MLPAYAPDPQARVHVFCHAVPGTWHAMGVMLSAAGLARLAAPRPRRADYATLDAEAARWAPGAEGLLFAPYLAGERTPHPDPDARGAFTGLSLRHDRGALWRAMLEGVAYGLRDSLELLRALGVRPELGRVSGGGARERAVAADRRLGARPAARAHRVRGGLGVRRGAARRRARRRLRGRADAVARCVRVRDRIEPDPEWSAAYERGYARYRSSTPPCNRSRTQPRA